MAAPILVEVAMSDNILSIIPADSDWQPTAEAADAAMAVLRRLAPQLDGLGDYSTRSSASYGFIPMRSVSRAGATRASQSLASTGVSSPSS